MELQAVISALEYLISHKRIGTNISIYSDSNLLIQSMTLNWKRKRNLDLWETLDHLSSSFSITWVKVKGHSTDRYNLQVDRLAVAESIRAQKSKLIHRSSQRSSSHFLCTRCGHETSGKLTWKEGNQSIRVDCLHCGRFIKFAPKTKILERLARSNGDLHK